MIIIVPPTLWEFVLLNFQRTDVRYSKKVGSLYESCLPCISCWIPVYPTHLSIEIIHQYEPPQGRLYLAVPERCQDCFDSHLVPDNHENIYLCRRCGITNGISSENTNSSYAQSCGPAFAQNVVTSIPRQFTPSSYKRLNHFRNTMTRLQAKEALVIPAGDYERLLDHLRRSNPKLISCQLTYHHVKLSLKCVHLQRYYNHVFWIIHNISGRRLVNLSGSQSKVLISMFMNIQEAFALHRNQRVNMLSYIYLIKKFSEVLGWSKLAKCLPLLKSREKIRQQDMIWRDICTRMGYHFYPSIM